MLYIFVEITISWNKFTWWIVQLISFLIDFLIIYENKGLEAEFCSWFVLFGGALSLDFFQSSCALYPAADDSGLRVTLLWGQDETDHVAVSDGLTVSQNFGSPRQERLIKHGGPYFQRDAGCKIDTPASTHKWWWMQHKHTSTHPENVLDTKWIYEHPLWNGAGYKINAPGSTLKWLWIHKRCTSTHLP